MPTGSISSPASCFHKDGVIVTQAPDIWFLEDTDGDGEADKVEKLYTGLGTGDTHAVINNPRWGWTAGSTPRTATAPAMSPTRDGSEGLRHRSAAASCASSPTAAPFEQYSSEGGNTWGLDITGDNHVIWTQPTSGTVFMQVVLPEYVLARGKIRHHAATRS